MNDTDIVAEREKWAEERETLEKEMEEWHTVHQEVVLPGRVSRELGRTREN
jgi:hypothetical protein